MMIRLRSRRLSASTATLALMAFAAPGAALAQTQSFEFNIPAQDLEDALRSFARTTRQQVVFRGPVVRGKRSNALVGSFGARPGLEHMLQGTGLSVETSPRGVLVVTAGAGGQTMPGESAGAESAEDTPDEAEEIVVTGTNIRGNANPTVAVISYDREDIDRSGYTTTQELLAKMPQNFAGGGAEGASETGLFGQGGLRFVNAGLQSGVNLRGLNSRATLTLIDGRRVAPAAQGLITADISMIPLSAVERIEVLPDGASAIYGADAVAGVVNVILRKDFEGQETRLRYGLATEGGLDEYRIGHAIGDSWSSGSFFVSGEYYDRTNLREKDRPGLMEPVAGRADLLPETDRLSFTAHFENDLSSDIRFFADALFSDGNTHYFEGDRVFETIENFVDSLQYSVAAGLEFDLGHDWRVKLDGTSGMSKLKTEDASYDFQGNAIQGGWSKAREWVHSANLLATGPLFALPAGDLSVAFGTSYLWSKFDQKGLVFIPGMEIPLARHTSREVFSAFGEVSIPLVDGDMDVPLVHRLSLSAAGRYDHYSDFGDTFNPKLGVAWSPFADLHLRANYSKSFRAPSSFEKVRENGGIPSLYIYPFTAPGGGGSIPVLVLGGSDLLGPEKSKNFSAGATFEPSFAPGLSVSVNYFDISYRDRIDSGPFSLNGLNEATYAPFVIDFGTNDAARAFVAEMMAQGALLNTPFPGYSLDGLVYGYDIRTKNLAVVDISGLDFAVDYSFRAGENRFALRLDAAYIDHIRTRAAAGSQPFDRVDTLGQPADFRARGSLTWSNGPFSATGTFNHVGGYVDETGPVDQNVDAFTTVDFSAAIDMGKAFSGAVFKGLTARLSIINLFDADPPYAVNAPNRAHFDQAYYDPKGRFVAFELTKRW